MLLLAALKQPIPISYLAGILGKWRLGVTLSVNSLEAFRVVQSLRGGGSRLIELDADWEAYPQLIAMLRALNALDPTYTALASGYEGARGRVSYIH